MVVGLGAPMERGLHLHTGYELVLLAGGDGVFATRFAERVLPVGQLLVVAPGVVHAVWERAADSRPPRPARTLAVDAALVGRYLTAADGPSSPTAALVDDAATVARFVAAHRALSTDGAADPYPALDALLRVVAGQLAGARGLHADAADASRRDFPLRVPPGEHGGVRRARAHLDLRWATSVSLADLAGVARLSPCHLARAFAREVGLPPHAYQLRLRVAHAADRLARGVDLSRVAHETGFADQSHMSRHFRAVYGMTPGAFAARFRRPAAARDASGGPPRLTGVDATSAWAVA